MNDLDLEREIRAAFRRRGADVLDPAAVPPVHEVLRQTRRQQATTILRVAAVVVAIVAASVAGVGALMRADDRRVPTEPPPDTFAAGPLEAVPTDRRSFSSLTATPDGALWWTGPGLTRFDPATGAIRTLTLADDPAFEDVAMIEPAREGGVWISSGFHETTATIRRFDGEVFGEDLGPGPVCDLAEAPDGTLWGSGCEGVGGVFRWDGASWVPAPSAEGLGGGAIAIDAEGSVWVANREYRADAETASGGVSRFDGTGWTTWTQSAGLPSDRVETVGPGPNGEVWVGTDDGVARFLDGSWVAYPGEQIQVPEVWSIVVTDDLVSVTGYRHNQSRFALFDGSTWTPVTTEDGLGATDSHPSVAADARGVLWAATGDAGLWRFDGSRWEQVVAPGGPSGFLGQIAAASLNRLWATEAGDNATVWRLEEGTWTRFGEGVGVLGESPAQIVVAPDGTAWVAAEGGLARFDGARWETVEPRPHHAIAFGPDGTSWTAADTGSAVDGIPSTGFDIHPVGGTAVGGIVPLEFSPTFLAVGPGDDVWASCFASWGGGGCDLAHFDGAAWGTVELPTTTGEIPVLKDIEETPTGDLWVSAAVQAGEDRQAPAVFRYRDGAWTELVETDAGTRLDSPSGEWFPGTLEVTPGGNVLLLARDGLYVLRGDSWMSVAGGRFSDLSVAPDGTVWLVGDGMFRMTQP